MKAKNEEITEEVRSLVKKINALPSQERTKFIFDVLEDELRNLRVGENDNVAGLYYVTMDLTQFKDINENRVIPGGTKRIKELAESIRKYGLLTPIIINEKFEKVDGQRRLKAIREDGLSTPIPYIIKKGANIEIISSSNQNQNPWNHRDWLHLYVETKREDYVKYNELAKEYEHYVRSRSLRGLFMDNRIDPLKSGLWEKGQFTIDYESLPKNIEYLEFLKKVYLIDIKNNVFVKDRGFQKALHEIIKKTNNIDYDRLLYKLRNSFNDINVRVDYKTYKKKIGDIYNKRLAGDRHHIITETEEPVKPPEVKGEKKQKKPR